MRTFGKKGLVVAAVALVWSAIQPESASAQTSGIGSDGYTRVLWRNTDGRPLVMKLDANLAYEFGKIHPAAPGYVPVALTVTDSNDTYLLWRGDNGSTSIWRLDSSLNRIGVRSDPNYDGWTAQSLSSGPGNELRVIWRRTDGTLSVWKLNEAMTGIGGREYGPWMGWNPGLP